MYTLKDFYRSNEWYMLMTQIKHERTKDDGLIYCEYCGMPIVRAYDCIGHHKEYLTENNVNDVEISLNPDNIMLVHHTCHNKIHNKLGYREKKVYLVYGAPYSGKKTYVNSICEPGDVIVSMDKIWQCITHDGVHDGRLKAIAFSVRDKMIECIRYRLGKWNTAYIIGGYPLISERQRLCRELGAEEILIEATKGDCLLRMVADKNVNPHEYKKYIEDWFEKYSKGNNRPPVLM